MNIELTEVMQREIVKQVSDKLFATIKGQINIKLLAEQAAKDVKAVLVSKVAGEFHKHANQDQIVAGAVMEAETRINKRIEKLLARGITISLKEE